MTTNEITVQTSEHARQPTAMDPVTFSVLMRRIDAVSQEMSLVLEASSWTSIIALCHDFSCVIYDRAARQVCMYDALPAQTTSMQLIIREINRTFGEDIHDGDVILMNDPYRGNTHIGDVVTATPTYVDGRHLFWSASKAHHIDIGAFIRPAAQRPRRTSTRRD